MADARREVSSGKDGKESFTIYRQLVYTVADSLVCPDRAVLAQLCLRILLQRRKYHVREGRYYGTA
jgi:hypothetical protein